MYFTQNHVLKKINDISLHLFDLRTLSLSYENTYLDNV